MRSLLAHWSLLWVLFAAVVAITVRHLSRCGRALVLLLAAQLGVYLVSYVFSDWHP